MSETNDQCSDTSSELNWPLDHPAAEHQQFDRVVFENVADQYVKGENVTAFFTILQDIKVNPNVDEIGLLRIGCTNIKECFAYAPVQFNPSTSSGSTRHGTATFPSTSLPSTDDEFYQFCYIINKTKFLGSSIPFQLNCAPDDIDLLSNAPVTKTKSNGLIALADHDNDDIVIIHTKQMLIEEKLRQENRQLFEMNRRVELQKDELQAKLDSLEIKAKEYIDKIKNDMQALTVTHKTTIDELSSRQQSETKLRTEYDAYRSLCDQYQAESVQHAERCRMLETAQSQILSETNQVRSQLAVTTQLTKDQATQIIDLERRLMQTSELSKTSNQRQALLEQQLRDLRLTSEKHQLSMQGQAETFAKQTEQINQLETTNNLLQEEMNSLKTDNECLALACQQEKELAQDLQQQLDQLRDQNRIEKESAQNEIELLQNQLNETNSSQQAYATLKNSFTEIEKRCVKHQKSEIEVKRQLSVYKNFVNDLQREIQDLTERINAGADEYKTLFRKYTLLERTMGINQQQQPLQQEQQQQQQEEPNSPLPTTTVLVNESVPNEEELFSLLRNTYDFQTPETRDEENVQDNQIISARASLANLDDEVHQCPMCYWEFPQHMTVDGKREHIEHHFQDN